MHSDEDMIEGLLVPEERPVPTFPNGDDDEEPAAGIELSSDEPMPPGLVKPTEQVARERTRATLIGFIGAYIAVWGLASLVVVAMGGLDSEQLTLLLNVFVTPFLPMLGLAVAFYFGTRRGGP